MRRKRGSNRYQPCVACMTSMVDTKAGTTRNRLLTEIPSAKPSRPTSEASVSTRPVEIPFVVELRQAASERLQSKRTPQLHGSGAAGGEISRSIVDRSTGVRTNAIGHRCVQGDLSSLQQMQVARRGQSFSGPLLSVGLGTCVAETRENPIQNRQATTRSAGGRPGVGYSITRTFSYLDRTRSFIRMFGIRNWFPRRTPRRPELRAGVLRLSPLVPRRRLGRHR